MNGLCPQWLPKTSSWRSRSTCVMSHIYELCQVPPWPPKTSSWRSRSTRHLYLRIWSSPRIKSGCLHVWHDPFISVTWLVHNVWHDSFIYATWLIHMYDVTHSYVWHDPFICVAWPIHTTWPISIFDLTHSYIWHDSFIYVTWLTHTSYQHTFTRVPPTPEDTRVHFDCWIMRVRKRALFLQGSFTQGLWHFMHRHQTVAIFFPFGCEHPT